MSSTDGGVSCKDDKRGEMVMVGVGECSEKKEREAGGGIRGWKVMQGECCLARSGNKGDMQEGKRTDRKSRQAGRQANRLHPSSHQRRILKRGSKHGQHSLRLLAPRLRPFGAGLQHLGNLLDDLHM
jgi:hypothetical protein